VITAIAIIMFYLAYLGVTVPMLFDGCAAPGRRPDHGPTFSLGRWGLPVNIASLAYGSLVAINIAWPRKPRSTTPSASPTGTGSGRRSCSSARS